MTDLVLIRRGSLLPTAPSNGWLTRGGCYAGPRPLPNGHDVLQSNATCTSGRPLETRGTVEDVPAARNQGHTSPSVPSSIAWGFRSRDCYVIGDVPSISAQLEKHDERQGQSVSMYQTWRGPTCTRLHEIPDSRDLQRLAAATHIVPILAIAQRGEPKPPVCRLAIRPSPLQNWLITQGIK